MTTISALGLSDPVFSSQTIFRHILSAMSAPGTIETLPQNICGFPAGISPAASATLLTLCDYETPLYSGIDYSSFTDWLRFYTGAPITQNPRDAKFAIFRGDDGMIKLNTFNLGDPRYPDVSATLIIECEGLEGGTNVKLTGPGIETARQIAPAGFSQKLWTEVAELHDHFPLGLDVIMTAGQSLMALPRSTRIVEIG